MPPILESTAQIDALRQHMATGLARLAAAGGRIDDPHAAVGETAFYLAYHGRDDLELQRAIASVYLRACPALGMLKVPSVTAKYGIPDTAQNTCVALQFGRSFFKRLAGRKGGEAAIEACMD